MGKKTAPATKAPVADSGTTSKKRDDNVSDDDVESIYSSHDIDDHQSLTDDDEQIPDITSTSLDSVFNTMITSALDKDNNVRFAAIDQIVRLFRRACVPNLAEVHRKALCDIVERGLRRTPEEVERVLRLAGVIVLQLGLDVEDGADAAIDAMCSVLADTSAAEVLRALCAEMLGICVYFGIYQPKKRTACLNALRAVWSTMKLAMPQHRLFSAAVLAWVLVLERCDSAQIEEAIAESQPRLCWYLGSNSPEARLAAGEALAVLYEQAVEQVDEDFRFANHPQLKNTFDEMAADSAKYHAKRDKRTQKFTFRQISDVIVNRNFPSSNLRFNNKRETLTLDGCHSKLLYDFLCRVLKSDISMHLTRNNVLRELFDLGAVLGADDVTTTKSRAQKVEQRNQFNANTKDRKIRRGKQRDKRDKGFNAEDD